MLSNYLYQLAAVAIFVAASFITGVFTGRDQVQDKWNDAKAVQTQAALAAERNARSREQALINQLNEAQYAATAREEKLRADYAAAHAAANSLRNTITAARNRLPTDTPAACHQTAATALDVFSECSAEVERLASAADAHASDVKTLTDAWPK
jgi:hypothetical protein